MKSILKKHKITQINLSSLLNCSQALISKWCSGKCEPSLNAIIKISEHFKIPIEEIVLAFRKKEGVGNGKRN